MHVNHSPRPNINIGSSMKRDLNAKAFSACLAYDQVGIK